MADIINAGAADVDFYDSTEYRKAFMNYVVTGKTAPEMQNASETTKTTDVGAVIPSTVLNRIIQKMEATGMILPEITRTAYKGGVSIPKSTVKPVATWVAEGAGSEAKKMDVKGSVTFAYHKLRCAVAVTLEVDTMALSAFETMLVDNVSEAMTKALENAIINGTGTGQPTGILKDAAPEGQNIELSDGAGITYATLVEAEAALPLAYESGARWVMSKKTFMGIIGLTDTAGQPIARVNYGLAGKPERTLLGRPVICCDYMESVNGTPEKDTVIAFLFNLKDYTLITNLNITVKTYEDNATDDQVTKAMMLVDGKVVDNNSLVTATAKASEAA